MAKKIAVLGGGVGAMFAAYQLTKLADPKDPFDITVYQMGWRLGGKGASGRNRLAGQRIEEHGLHVWGGFYDNAIKLMRQCYEELNPPGATNTGVFSSFDEAFVPWDDIALADRLAGGWEYWQIKAPVYPEEWDGHDRTPWGYIVGILRFVDWSMNQNNAVPDLFQVGGPGDSPLDPWIEAKLQTRAPGAGLHSSRLRQLRSFAEGLHPDARKHRADDYVVIRELIERLLAQLRHPSHQPPPRSGGSCRTGLRLVLDYLEFGFCTVWGCIRDGVLTGGYAIIDGEEATAWLRKHGASEALVSSGLMRAFYSYVFGYRDGVADMEHRAVGAGTATHAVFRMCTYFDYRHLFARMQAGMGDTVFTPFYKALKKAGVKFRFFHKVTGIRANDDGTRVESIFIDQQVALVAGRDEYEPLVPVQYQRADGRKFMLDCWPSAPRYEQLDHGKDLENSGVDFESNWNGWKPSGNVVLKQGVDFDDVVLGISLGALPHICGDLADRDSRWKGMFDNVKTCRTLACQIWTTKGQQDSGWCDPSTRRIMTSFAEPLDTWADMSHLLAAEPWARAKQQPQMIGYFCGPLSDDIPDAPPIDAGFPKKMYDEVKRLADGWVQDGLRRLWPDFVDASGVKADCLMPWPGRDKEADRWRQQYFRANIDPSERYVLSVPGSAHYRLRSDESGFDHLFLAGDWTRNGFNAGCVEAAAMSGMRAAAGVAGKDIDIVGEEEFPDAGNTRPYPMIVDGLSAPLLPSLGALAYGHLHTAAAFAMLRFPAKQVAQMLPPDLVLDDRQTLTQPGQHPVTFFFGWQQGVRPNGVPRWLGLNYRECIVGIPYVRWRNPSTECGLAAFAYMPRLYLDSELPVLMGVLGYGYEKVKANIEANDWRYVVSDPKAGGSIRAEYQLSGTTGRLVDLPKLRELSKAFRLPLLSRMRWGAWVTSFFDFDLDRARIQPADIEIYIDSLAPLPDAFNGFHFVPGANRQDNGGIFFASDCTITNPWQTFSLNQRIGRSLLPPNPQLLPFPPRK